ncbi:MAG: hypothetical protein AVDCRST_MAG49-2717 [uncultured Thermomicrobiales bacterium]|uniref:Uncharacterized protein n=1 Tax=uncultured Thermomicrobiales bacterium TaxID=1645740 RepID=A0A6J4UXL9_9BACT|nr:MAG: hypothetical protein AVDCRST_MAG49-2717 [uncultured Thermomicrobiales bacterium]
MGSSHGSSASRLWCMATRTCDEARDARPAGATLRRQRSALLSLAGHGVVAANAPWPAREHPFVCDARY